VAQAELEARKETDEEIRILKREEDAKEESNQVPPLSIQTLSRLKDDIDIMYLLMDAECPPLRRVGAHRKVSILYCFGDALGGDFCLSIEFEQRI
jgi:hypothetical protein